MQGLPTVAAPRMSVTKIRFTSAAVTRLVLAKIGHPQRDEPLQTSKKVFEVADEDQGALTALFVKPFKSLAGYRFNHHSSLDQHEMNQCATAIFESPEGLLEKGCDIAKRLYTKSNHPNIKSGDLCIAFVEGIDVNGDLVQGICILKSESVVPFLSISTKDGDLHLHTEQGINPEKIDKGCLILNHQSKKGFYVLTFDRSGSDSRFWVRDFLGVVAITDSPFLTYKFANMAVAFAKDEEKAKKKEKKEEREEAPAAADEQDDAPPPWEAASVAKDAMSYFEEKEQFSLQEFEEQVLRTPEAVEKFRKHKEKVEEEQGQRFDESFEISKKDVSKAKKRISTVVKLDTGVEIHVKPGFADQEDPVLERGFDDEKGMKFIKVFFNGEV